MCSLPWRISWAPWGYLEYYGECLVPWQEVVVSWVPWSIFSTVGGCLEYHREYLEYGGGCSVMWMNIILHVAGYHQYRGECSVPQHPGPTFIMIYLTILSIPHSTKDILLYYSRYLPQYWTHVIWEAKVESIKTDTRICPWKEICNRIQLRIKVRKELTQYKY